MTRAESLRSTSVAFTIVPIEKSKRTFVALLRDSDYRRYYSRRPLQAGRGLSTPLIKSQMNDISGAIISYCYYRDGYYVSRGARLLSRSPLSLFLCRSLLSILLPLASSQASLLSLSISLLFLLLLHLLLLLLSLETLLLLHARNQVTALQESKSRGYARERGLVLSNIYLYPPERDDD